MSAYTIRPISDRTAFDEERELVTTGWSLTEWPGQWHTDTWRQLFIRVGFVCTDDHDACDPPDSMSLYRGSFASEKRGLSWTADLDRARWFANRGDMAGKGRTMRVWTVNVPSHRLYAHLTNRGEDEWVADVRSLHITEITP